MRRWTLAGLVLAGSSVGCSWNDGDQFEQVMGESCDYYAEAVVAAKGGDVVGFFENYSAAEAQFDYAYETSSGREERAEWEAYFAVLGNIVDEDRASEWYELTIIEKRSDEYIETHLRMPPQTTSNAVSVMCEDY